MTLLPQKDAEPYFVKGWRQIILLNSGYKIAAKAIDNESKCSSKTSPYIATKPVFLKEYSLVKT